MVFAVAVGSSFQVGAAATGPCSWRACRGYRLACEAVRWVDRNFVVVGDRLGSGALVAIADLAMLGLVV